MTNKQFWIGILIGSAVGTLAALLFAPQQGADTRGKISDVTKSAGRKVTGVASSVKDKVKEKVRGHAETVEQSI